MFKDKLDFLSNFYLSPIWMYCKWGVFSFESAEHAYQAMKAEREEEFNKIRTASSPGAAKRWGKRCKLVDGWESIKLDVMEGVVRRKFRQNTKLRKALKKVPHKELIEFNTWCDNFWGDCVCDKCKGTVGKNHLGKILQKIQNGLT